MPSDVSKGPVADAAAVPARTPRQQTGSGIDTSNTALQQQITRLSETVDSLLQFINAVFGPPPTTRTSGTIGTNAANGASAVTNTSQTSDLNMKGAFNPDLKVRRNIIAGNSLSVQVVDSKGTRTVYRVDSTGAQTALGPFDVTGNSIIRGNLRVTGATTTG